MKIEEDAWVKLVSVAKEVIRNAHCPYSRFAVGAAVLSRNGIIFPGCNIENASFGLTLCAERSAIFNAIVHGEKEVKAIVVFTNTAEPSLPCGACRQVIREFGRDVELRCYCAGTSIETATIEELLPKAFLFTVGRSTG